MANKSQSKPAAKTPAAAQTSVDPRETGPVGKAPEATQEQAPKRRRIAEDDAPVVDKEPVTVTVPKPFRMLTNEGMHEYPSGIYEMPRHHAEHWYAQVHGVEIKD